MSELAIPRYADRELFSLHEEEDVVEVPPHRLQVAYFETSLRLALRDRYVGANMGVYWVPGQLQEPWTGPDLLVASRPRRDPPRVWLTYEDGPLQFVAEVASDRTRRGERKKREEIYRDALAVPEALYVDLDRHQLELWRLKAGDYSRVRAVGGRLYSGQLDMWFGWDPERALVRIWDQQGRMLPTPEEMESDLERERELRMAAEQRTAELSAEIERLRRGE